jgi:hydroxymethylpyrimidine/phosphomethylpyrimidine kinase
VDLRELELTAYGYEILTALGMHLTTNLEGLERVKNAFAEQGFELKTGDTSVSGVKMGDELKQAIWWIIDNRGRRWGGIKH